MNWFKNNNMVLVNVKLVLNIGSDVLLFPFQTAANWGMKKCRYCCGEYAFHLYYLVGFGWDFFQSIIFWKSFHVCNSIFFGQGLELECLAVLENVSILYEIEHLQKHWRRHQQKSTQCCISCSCMHRGLSSLWLCKSALLILKQFCSDSSSWLEGNWYLKNT